MELKRRIALAVALVSVGLGAGHFVQNSGARPQREPVPGIRQSSIVPLAAVAEDIQAPVAESKPVLPTAALVPTVASLPDPTPGLPEFAETECQVLLDLAAQPLAMIGLTLTAPCRTNERVVVRHGGLAVTARTSATGALHLDLPAMESAATVSVLFADGETTEAMLDMPAMAGWQRFAVQWMEDDAFQIHAFENGADYGQPGHVSASNPHLPPPGTTPAGGFLTVMGDDGVALPMLAEVYTYPATAAKVDMVVEATVTGKTCGRELMGETLASQGGKVIVTDLTVAMPDCAAAGDILVLKNLVPEMTFASR